ncbi:helix-turn-helix domain-containing protein [Mycolicibacterium cosmeticum]|uniref:helix-turn-helix domain-containing protein n=1 Tax=Mycolicibacterium cosmeticum TaxID=258533 RepID=UPI003204D025
MEKRLYSRSDASEYLNKSLREIDRMIRSGRLIAKKDGRRTVIERAELDRYADRLPMLLPEHRA